jgi:predicted esterase
VVRATGVLFLMSLLLLPAQVYSPGPQVVTYYSAVDDTDQPYGLYVPKEFDPAKKYPLVISLHGAGSNHRLNLRRVFGRGNMPGETDGAASRHFPRLGDVDFIVACPLARGTMGYEGIAEQDVYDVLADVKRRFPIDDDRVYLTGLSMGGGGALRLGLTRPDIWAAIAPVCAGVPEGTDELAPNSLNLTVHLFQGALDPLVPAASSRHWYQLLLDAGASVEYIEYPGVRHNSWDFAYRNRAIFDWFRKCRRNRFPPRVRFVTRSYKYDSAYWVHLDGLAPGVLASIDTRFVENNQIVITTEHVDGFTLNLAGHPMFSWDKALSLRVNGVALETKGKNVVSLSRQGDSYRLSRWVPPQFAKRPGAEGPIAEAIASRHLYVYGTADSPTPEEVERRREQAATAADWTSRRGPLSVSFRTMADKTVRNANLKGTNLILFGSKETNSLIAQYADRLPLALNAGAADYGLVFIAPVGDHYVLVNSGLPWWTGADEAQRPGLRSASPPYHILGTFKDFILFRGSLENVVAEGSFDRNWKTPADLAAKMIATGAVRVR